MTSNGGQEASVFWWMATMTRQPSETELPKSEYVMEVSVIIQPSFLSRLTKLSVTARLSCLGCTKAMMMERDWERCNCVTIKAWISQKWLVGLV